MTTPKLGAHNDLSIPANRPGAPKRQCCRKCLRSAVPAVTLTFDDGARRLHWCSDHADDADLYRGSSDQR